MRVFLSAGAFIVVLALLTAVGRPLSGQTGDNPIPCLFDWSTGFDAVQVTRFAADLVEPCTDARTVGWDEKITAAERAVSVFGGDTSASPDITELVAEWRKVLSMLAREKQHL